MYNVVLVGVGSLGKRHLQSLVNLSNDCKIYAVEKNEDVLSSLKAEFEGKAIVTNRMEDLPRAINVAVIATSSNVRKSVFDELMKISVVENIIFEKVLFQKESDYFEVQKYIAEHNMKAWVNCARREWPSYIELKEYLNDSRSLTFSVSGGEWGMGCNAIHMIDLMEYLSGDNNFELISTELSGPIIQSKRKGFIEFYGSIIGRNSNCKLFTITCLNNNHAPTMITICSDEANIVIDESKQRMKIAELSNNWQWIEKDFPMKYQSQLTEVTVKSILDTGDCHLPDFEVSMEAHLKYIRGVKEFLSKKGYYKDSEMNPEICPIT